MHGAGFRLAFAHYCRYKYKMGFADDFRVCQMGNNLAQNFNAAVQKLPTNLPRINFLLWNEVIGFDDDYYSVGMCEEPRTRSIHIAIGLSVQMEKLNGPLRIPIWDGQDFYNF